MTAIPPRVHILLARKAPVAVAIRRGPSRQVCTIGWDRRTDRFEVGQWFRGRIYERRCDLSPDGRHLIYFAMDGRWTGPAKGSWTAISRAPHLKALALWPNGSGWNGGGLFLTARTFWLNAGLFGSRKATLPRGLEQHPGYPFTEGFGGECPGVYYLRLQRDGWTRMPASGGTASESLTLFEKALPKGWVLEKTAHETVDPPRGRGCYHDTHRLVHPGRGLVRELPGWEWAELDRHHVVWVKDGILHRSAVTGDGIGDTRPLFDFNPLGFEAIPAPY